MTGKKILMGADLKGDESSDGPADESGQTEKEPVSEE